MAEYTYNTVPTSSESRDSTFRCKVVGPTAATLRAGSRVYAIDVRETSGSGFTLGIPNRIAKRLKVGKRYELYYDERRILVAARHFLDASGGESRLEVVAVREYEPKERWAFRLPFTKGSRVITQDSASTKTIAYGGFVLVLFCIMALPGIGEDLGTAPRIHKALRLIGNNVAEVVHRIRN